jgi:microcompartment protein CcmL/EutN
MRMRLLPYLAAAVLGVLAAGVAACGSDRSDLIPADSAESLSSILADVEQAVGDGDCDAAQSSLSRARGALVNLPESVDDRLVARLEEGVENLESIAPEECASQEQQTTTVPTTTEATPTETTATETTPTETTATETTTTTTPTETTTTTAPTTTTEPAPPADTSGGVQGEGAATR